MPKTKWEGYERFCPFARALDVIGERWTLVIIHELLGGPARYTEIKSRLPGIGTNVLSDRLRKLEAAAVVERTLGDVADGVRYQLTERGHTLGPAMAELRRWGADELLADIDEPQVFDLTYAIPAEVVLSEAYEWIIDGRPLALTIDGPVLTLQPGPASAPAVVVQTSTEFMRRWAAGETNWDRGRAEGEVSATGPEEAWERMLVATNYPGRPNDLTARLLAAARAEAPTSSAGA